MEAGVPAPMRDGVALRADVYRPAHGGPYPVLLTRTPYNKSAPDGKPTPQYVAMAQAGYIVVVQDIRGRYASDGDFHSLFGPDYPDIEDGYDTVEWCARLPGANGKVGAFGNSYGGFTAWCAALSQAPSLGGVFAEGITVRLDDFEPIFRPGRRLAWMLTGIAPDLRRKRGLPGPYTVAEAQELWARERWKWLWYLPRKDVPEELLADLAPNYHYLLQHPGVDTFRWLDRLSGIRVPIFHRTGWYDRFVRAIDGYVEVAKHVRSPEVRATQRLLVGPWGHTNNLSTYEGEVDFGPEGLLDRTVLILRWFDWCLKGITNGIEQEGPVRIFVMGANRWRDEQEWPPARTRYVEYYLQSGGQANTSAGDGKLSMEPPDAQPPDQFVYDPRDPVPSCHLLNDQDGCVDQRRLDHRRDILVYQTPPLTEAIEVTGEVTVQLFAASTAVDTDFTAKLVDVHPNGFAQNLSYGIVRARFRKGYAAPQLLIPGLVYEFTIRLNPTSNVFLPGHRIRLDISSSDFPNFERNLNTGGDSYTDTSMVVARQTVFHDARHPSRIILPVIPDGG